MKPDTTSPGFIQRVRVIENNLNFDFPTHTHDRARDETEAKMKHEHLTSKHLSVEQVVTRLEEDLRAARAEGKGKDVQVERLRTELVRIRSALVDEVRCHSCGEGGGERGRGEQERGGGESERESVCARARERACGTCDVSNMHVDMDTCAQHTHTRARTNKHTHTHTYTHTNTHAHTYMDVRK